MEQFSERYQEGIQHEKFFQVCLCCSYAICVFVKRFVRNTPQDEHHYQHRELRAAKSALAAF